MPDKESVTRYAFIDVQNTESTALQILGFPIDWIKLYRHLKDRWKCKEIYFYSGISEDNIEIMTEYSTLKGIGYIMRLKPYKIYNEPMQIKKVVCDTCFSVIELKIKGDVRWKSNCDTELSVDATVLAEDNVEFIILTGDGDFEYLIRHCVDKGSRIYVVSSAKKMQIGNRYFTSRLSIKLRNIFSSLKDMVYFIDLNSWRLIIEKSR